MKTLIPNPLALFLNSFATALLICSIGSATAAEPPEEDFPSLVKRLQKDKPEFSKRHKNLLSDRYDLADHAAQGVTMSRGKPVQQGVRVRLPKDIT